MKDDEKQSNLNHIFNKSNDTPFITRTDLCIYDYETKEYIQRVISDLESRILKTVKDSKDEQKAEMVKQTEFIGQIKSEVSDMKSTIIQLMAGLIVTVIIMFVSIMIYNIFGVAL